MVPHTEAISDHVQFGWLGIVTACSRVKSRKVSLGTLICSLPMMISDVAPAIAWCPTQAWCWIEWDSLRLDIVFLLLALAFLPSIRIQSPHVQQRA